MHFTEFWELIKKLLIITKSYFWDQRWNQGPNFFGEKVELLSENKQFWAFKQFLGRKEQTKIFFKNKFFFERNMQQKQHSQKNTLKWLYEKIT